MIKIRTHLNEGEWQNRRYEVNNLPSMTVPDQAMSIREIMDRYARGLPVGGSRTPIFEGDDDVMEGIDPRTLDLSELQALKEDAKALELASRQKLEDARKKKDRRKEALLRAAQKDDKKNENPDASLTGLTDGK